MPHRPVPASSLQATHAAAERQHAALQAEKARLDAELRDALKAAEAARAALQDAQAKAAVALERKGGAVDSLTLQLGKAETALGRAEATATELGDAQGGWPGG